MSILLFRLRNVPDDEANDIREILHDHNLEFYETSAGNWGISTAAIWLKNNNDLDDARTLIDRYQENRTNSQRALYKQLKRTGNHTTLLASFKESPLRFIIYILFSAFILYLSIKPFISLAN
jgi:hypothetical protein